jgi:hypothetical protein
VSHCLQATTSQLLTCRNLQAWYEYGPNELLPPSSGLATQQQRVVEGAEAERLRYKDKKKKEVNDPMATFVQPRQSRWEAEQGRASGTTVHYIAYV